VKLQSSFQLALVSSAAVITLIGCGAPTSRVPAAPAIYPFDVTTFRPGVPPMAHRDRTRSWMARDAKESDLVYVSSEMTWDVNVYSYPQGERKGLLTGFNLPQGVCSDPNGDVFVPEGVTNDIKEYAHGGTSVIAYLSDPNEEAEACSFDPTTGTLAVANVISARGAGNIALYANATGSPTIVSDSAIYLPYECGYDDKGNLFVDGLTGLPSEGGVFQFAELPKGSSSFTNITLNRKIKIPGAVQWDGTYVTVADAQTGAIYRTNGADGKVVGSTKLAGTRFDFQSWIQGKNIVAPRYYSIVVGFSHYPAGGKVYKTIKVGSPFGTTVSLAAK
jgi:hypothetical protein